MATVVWLHEETPVKQPLAKAKRKVKKLRGAQTTTWLRILEKQLKELVITPEEAANTAQDRKECRKSRVPCVEAPGAL